MATLGARTIGSSTSTTFGDQVRVHYGPPGWSAAQVTPLPEDYGKYLTAMDMDMYLLTPKSQDAFWIPAGAKAAFDRGNDEAARNILVATSNQIKAESGKAIPTATAERWIIFIELILSTESTRQ